MNTRKVTLASALLIFSFWAVYTSSKDAGLIFATPAAVYSMPKINPAS